ncbi:MAG TPA: DUF1223 domain-containing protein, partial [Polyangiaceae bacterium]
TSEGCSSCPPADDVLADLARSSRAAGTPVFPLAFHVDYWDELGWPDRFASPTNTDRQRAYGRSFGARGMYTPQMVVDGTEEFTGSDRSRADAAVAGALARPAPAHLTVAARRDGAGAVVVDWSCRGAAPGSTLNVAIVQDEATTSVRAGENAGRVLRHVDVVRSFASVRLGAPAGSTTLAAPPDLRGASGQVVAFVQRPPSPSGGMPIEGAAAVPLPE